ncbi:MAG: hypothetical protein ACON4O_04960 [Lentimonas sp.]
MQKPLILSLQSVELAPPLTQTGESLLLTELLLPRPGIARKSTLKELQLTKGKRSFARAPFYEKGLLKEKVDGRFGISVSVTRPLKNPKVSQIFRRILAAGVEGGADLLSASLLKYAPLNDLVDEAADQFADHILADETFIAIGGIDLDSETLNTGIVSIPLKLTETIRSSGHLKASEKREKRRSQDEVYRKGTVVGTVKLHIEVS